MKGQYVAGGVEASSTKLVDDVSVFHGMMTAMMDHVSFIAARSQQNDLNRRKANHVNDTGSVGRWFERSNRELREFAEQQRKESDARWCQFLKEIS